MLGILLINKPQQMTSHDVVAILRRKLNIKRIGHTGTLDPNVTGVLPICIGPATRLSEYIMHQGKSYRCTMKFGKSTTTYDKWGDTVNESTLVEFDRDEIIGVLKKFTGKISQRPPIYSAIKIKGKKLYDYARQDKDVEIPSREVTIYSIELLSIYRDQISFDVACSKGTYIRSLVHDIGLELGTYAYMTDLVRTRVGRFNLSDCVSIDQIKKLESSQIEGLILPINKEVLYNLSSININDDIRDRILNGQKINLLNYNGFSIDKNHLDKLDQNNLAVFCNGDFLGIGKVDNNIFKMERVIKND